MCFYHWIFRTSLNCFDNMILHLRFQRSCLLRLPLSFLLTPWGVLRQLVFRSLWMRPLFVRAKCGINWLFCVSNHKAVVMVNTSLSRHISAPFKSCFSLEVWEGFSLSSLWSLCLLCPSAQYLKNHVMINHSDGYCLPTLDSIAPLHNVNA